ncbi:MAG: Phospho-N-acetylmuramoyl-pentapeptide-transferase [Acidimicrobiia bacterium]|nr:Phospho-N-acetylmuramoyl-pentapeptide-transferase [Acidimicrobiia bacterium]
MIALLLAGGVSMLVSLFGTAFLIRFLSARHAHQPILANEGVNAPQHQHKAGTPSMGGLAIVAAAVMGYLAAHLRSKVYFTDTGMLVLGAVCAAGAVGLADDLIKVRNARNLGLSKRAKSLGMLAVGCGFAVLMIMIAKPHTTLSFTRFDAPGIELSKLGWGILTVLVIQGASNSVNITDGLDGLAAGSAAMGFGAFVVIAYWGFRHYDIYQFNYGFDLAVISVSLLGGCAGFLWWNAAPARIFMGDTGSLAIGTAMAALALTTNTVLLLPIIGGLYVAETTSVIMQITSYRYFGKRRIFRMAPIHHHFELKGWPETTVIIRFWILAGMCTALGLGIYYADWVSTGALD